MGVYWRSATKPVRIAFWVAIAVGCLACLAVVVNPVIGLLEFVLSLLLAWGIRRGQSGAAWAAGLFFSVPLVALLVLRSQATTASVIWAVVALACAWCFFRAALVLQRDSSAPHVVWPWAVLAILLIAPALVVRPYRVSAGSMAETLLPGDYVLTETLSPHFAAPLKRGEIITLHYPLNPSQLFIKRVIGIPGDHIRIVNKQLYRNGSIVAEPYANHLTDFTDPYRDNFPSAPTANLPAPALEMLTNDVRGGELIVPEGKYFVLGDNRDDSLDSRYWGFISKSDLYGRPMLIYGSNEPKGVPTVLTTRWNRLLKRL